MNIINSRDFLLENRPLVLSEAKIVNNILEQSSKIMKSRTFSLFSNKDKGDLREMNKISKEELCLRN